MMSRDRISGALLGVVLVFGVLAGCGEVDPVKTLQVARQSYKVEALSWAEGTPVIREGGTTQRVGVISLRVTDEDSPIQLPCLTVDVVFLGKGEDRPELGREAIELDLTGIGDAGGSLERTRRLDLPEGLVDLGVASHQATAEHLRDLCEGKVLDSNPS